MTIIEDQNIGCGPHHFEKIKPTLVVGFSIWCDNPKQTFKKQHKKSPAL